jgi:curved DNA-binding protein CbpA
VPGDPYKTLGVSRNASDQEVRKAYRRLVQQHHPDHNGGSQESARRFEEVQAAYTRIREERIHAGHGASPPPTGDESLADRLADMEQQVKRAAAARAQALKDAREAAAEALGRRATDEELGYVTTDDNFGKILADARDEFLGRIDDIRKAPETKRTAQRAADLFDELGAMLRGERRSPPE